MSASEIAEAIGWSDAQVRVDVRTLGGHAALSKDVPQDAGERYAKAFCFFALAWSQISPKEVNQYVIKALERWLKIDKIKVGLDDLQKICTALTDLSDDDSDAAKIWRSCFVDPLWNAHESLFEKVKRDMLMGRAPRPRSVEDAISIGRRQAAQYIRADVAPWFTDDDRAMIMGFYHEGLKARQKDVLGQRLGLCNENGQPGVQKTFKEIGDALGLGVVRIRQIEREARGALVHRMHGHPRLMRFKAAREVPSLSSVVSQTMNSELAKKLRDAEARVAILTDQLVQTGATPANYASSKFNPHLTKRVDELELSVRTQNCLENAGIEYIYQLVEKTEAQMLKTENFGRKSLNEIKEILTDLDLSLGMTLDPEFKRPVS